MLDPTALLDVRVLGLSAGPGAPASTLLLYELHIVILIHF